MARTGRTFPFRRQLRAKALAAPEGIVGSGALLTPVPVVNGVGVAQIVGSAALLTPVPVVDGVGVMGIMGSGALVMPVPVVDGAGVAQIVGSAALVVPVPIVSGVGVAQIVGTAVLVLPVPVVVGVGSADYTVLPTLRVRPRVFIHDASTLRRIAQVVSVSGVNRSYGLREHVRQAEFSIAMSDEAAWRTAPALANVVAIESDEYPHPWVGRIIEREHDHMARVVTVRADSYDVVLGERWLPASYQTRPGARGAFAGILGQLNGQNATGIALGSVDNLGAPEISLANTRGIEALDKLCLIARGEWWLSYYYADGALVILANLAAERGTDYYDTVTLTQPGNFALQSSLENARRLAYAVTVVGGQSSVLESFSERERGVAVRDRQFSRSDGPRAEVASARRAFRHGRLVAGELDFTAPTQRRELLQVREELKAEGVSAEAATAMLESLRPSNAVIGRVYPDDEGERATTWRFLTPGNTVHLVSADAFGTGYDGPAVVTGVQPMEHERFMDVTVEVA